MFSGLNGYLYVLLHHVLGNNGKLKDVADKVVVED